MLAGGISDRMIRITAKIQIGDDGGKLSYIYNNRTGGINASMALQEVIGHNTPIQKPFILGRSRLGGGDCFTKKANFFIGAESSDQYKIFQKGYKFSLRGENITQITIVFNKEKNEYPRSITIDGETFYDDDPTWTIPIASGNEHVIEIMNWNKAFSPLVITSLYTDLSIELDESNLIDFERTIMDRSDTSAPSYGVISNSGSLSFIDVDGEVADYVAQQIVNSKNIISAHLYNDKTGIERQIAYFNAQKWSYQNSQSLVSITLKDDLEEWQYINVSAIYYNPKISTPKSAEWLYREVHKQTPAKYKMLEFEELDDETKAVLSGTTIKYPILESGSLWSAWDKLCQLCFLRIFKNNSGRTVCKYSIV